MRIFSAPRGSQGGLFGSKAETLHGAGWMHCLLLVECHHAAPPTPRLALLSAHVGGDGQAIQTGTHAGLRGSFDRRQVCPGFSSRHALPTSHAPHGDTLRVPSTLTSHSAAAPCCLQVPVLGETERFHVPSGGNRRKGKYMEAKDYVPEAVANPGEEPEPH